MTDPRTSRRVLKICDGAVLLSGDAREHYLIEACNGDGEVREQVDNLLQAVEDSGSFMQIDESRDRSSD